uniref:T-cell surface antigen CD2-like n=1 Tax=Semicossyphus pulcher TaxID=241346 RepID=UPI0037E70F06
MFFFSQLDMRRMKVDAAFSISVLLLCCSVISFTESADSCDHNAPVGGNFLVPLLIKLKASDRLKWIHDNVTIFNRRDSSVSPGKPEDISADGALQLRELKKEHAGMYTAEFHNSEGISLGTFKPVRLCILDPVNNPVVKVICQQGGKVKFTCTGNMVKDVRFQWRQNNKELKDSVGESLVQTAAQVQKDEFTCTVSNKVSNKSSKAVKEECHKPDPIFPSELFGISTWVYVGAGGGIVLVLLIIVIVCCVKNRRKKSMHVKDEEEFRLGWSNPNQQQQQQQPQQRQQQQPPNQRHHHHQQHQQQQQHHHQQPAGHTGPRPHRSKQQRHRAPDQPGAQIQPSPRRPAQAPKPTDEEQPPPLPQPRKKAPKTPRV